MTEAKHTPGPWKADDRPDWYPWPETVCICAGDRTIAWTTSDAANRDRDIADAHLIAAAPEMLVALKRIRTQINFDITRGGGLFSDCDIEAVDRALAKATAYSSDKR